MVASFEDAELFPISKHHLEAYLAFFVVFLDISCFLSTRRKVTCVLADPCVEIVTALSIFAETGCKKLADNLFFVAIQEVLNQCILIFLHRLEDFRWYILENTSAGTYSPDDLPWLVILVHYDLVSLVAELFFIVVFKDVRAVFIRRNEILRQAGQLLLEFLQ